MRKAIAVSNQLIRMNQSASADALADFVFLPIWHYANFQGSQAQSNSFSVHFTNQV